MNNARLYEGTANIGMSNTPSLNEASLALQKAMQRMGEASIHCGETTNPELVAHRAKVLAEAAGECHSAAYTFERAAFAEATKK